MTLANQVNMSYFNQSDTILGSDMTLKVELWTSSEALPVAEHLYTPGSSDNMNLSTPLEDDLFNGLYLHPHWLRHRELIEAAPQGFLFVVGVYMTLICFAGIVGNLTVIAVFLR
jgi:hypothetical protein